jgi:hypothetical protein
MIKDSQLDQFNRGLIFLLYKTYLNHLDEKESIQKIQVLKNGIADFPDFIQPSIKNLNIEVRNRR